MGGQGHRHGNGPNRHALACYLHSYIGIVVMDCDKHGALGECEGVCGGSCVVVRGQSIELQPGPTNHSTQIPI